MATTCKLIAKQVLGSDTSSVSFSSIPATYTDLLIVGTARATTNPFSEAWFFGTMGFNSDGNGVNQSGRHVVGGGGGGSVDSFTTGPRYYFTSSGATASTFGSFEIYIPNYAGSTAKSVSISSNSENNGSPNMVHMGAGLWSGTAAITQLVLYPRQDSFASGSSFYLYGITKA